MATLLNHILTSDAAGADTYTFPNIVKGHVEKICVDYAAGCAAGTDLTVHDLESGHVYLQLLNNNADGCWHPRGYACDEFGAIRLYAALGWEVPTPDYCEEMLTLTLAQAGAGNTVEVWIWVRH